MSTGRAVRAIICIRLDANRGEWVSVADLAAHMAVSPAALYSPLLDLESQHLLELQRSGSQVTAARVPATLGEAQGVPA